MTAAATEQPKRRTLYEITQQLLATIDASGGEITDEIDTLGLSRAEKLEAYRAVILRFESEAAANKALAKQTAEEYELRAKCKLRKAEKLKERVRESMQALGETSIRTPTCTVFLRSSKSVEIANEEAFCALAKRYVIEKVTARPDKKAIKEALERGEVVDGAKLVESVSVNFR